MGFFATEPQKGGGVPARGMAGAEGVALAAWAALPRTGKPNPGEGAVLAAFAVSGRGAGRGAGAGGRGGGAVEWRAVALGSGNKCLGGSLRAPELVSDSHAEVIARRALVRWIVGEVARGEVARRRPPGGPAFDSPLERIHATGRWRMKAGFALHLYVSQTPCGDCSVLGAAQTTGAKVVASPTAAPVSCDVEKGPPAAGRLRRKPGRGDATLSMSCSDKIAKWCVLGLQGALLAGILEGPLALASVTVAVPDQELVPQARVALRRALHGRLEGLVGMGGAQPASIPDLHVVLSPPESSGLVPGSRPSKSGVAINWDCGSWDGSQAASEAGVAPPLLLPQHGVHEVTLAASGRKAGAAKRTRGWISPKTVSSLSRIRAAERFCRVAPLVRGASEPMGEGVGGAPAGVPGPGPRTYADLKAWASPEYVRAWSSLRKPPSLFSSWLDKPAEQGSFEVPPWPTLANSGQDARPSDVKRKNDNRYY